MTLCPLISVVMPCYNQADFLPEAFASVADQTFRDFEIIIVDDGSSDSTEQTARMLIDSHPQIAVRLVQQTNRGLAEARNAGIRVARGKWILPLDSDDRLAPSFMAEAMRTASENPAAGVIGCQVQHFGARTDVWLPEAYDHPTLLDHNLFVCSCFFRKELWTKLGGYDPSHPWGLEDWHFWIRCSLLGAGFTRIERPLFFCRKREEAGMSLGMYARWKESLCLHYTMLPEAYPLDTVLAAHNALCEMPDPSLDRLNRKIEQWPNLPLPLFWKGLALEGRGRNREALACYLQSASAGSEAWQTSFCLSRLYQRLGEAARARLWETQAVQAHPSLMNVFAEEERRKREGTRKVLLIAALPLRGAERQWESVQVLAQNIARTGHEVHTVLPSGMRNPERRFPGTRVHTFPLLEAPRTGPSGWIEKYELLVRHSGFDNVLAVGEQLPSLQIAVCLAGKRAIALRANQLTGKEWDEICVAENSEGPCVDNVFAPRASHPRRVLLLCSHFWPSSGGVEHFMEHLGVGLVERGYEIHVATGPVAQRASSTHRGMTIHTFSHLCEGRPDVPGGLNDAASLIVNGGFDCLIMLSDTTPWARAICTLPGRPRLLYLPVMNLEGIQRHLLQGDYADMVADISRSDVLCAISEAGCETQVLKAAGSAPLFVPHAVPPVEPKHHFRESHGIAAEQPLFVHVANFWPVKNHLGLLRHLRSMRGDWKLILFGNPVEEAPECAAAIRAAAARDARVMILESPNHDLIMAAIREADALLLASHAEGCPLCVLEAMSQGTPWLATPSCGSVLRQAGGIAVDLSLFPLLLAALISSPSLRRRLGALGKAHWKVCFQPSVIVPVFESLIRKENCVPDLRYPQALQQEMSLIQKEIIQVANTIFPDFLKNR